jgi:dUTP pyrophosphatase
MIIQMKKLDPQAQLFTYATAGAAAADMYALTDAVVMNGGVSLVRTGIAVQIPEGFVGLVCSRSGLAHKSSVAVKNSPGVIDPDYRGDVGVILENTGPTAFFVRAGDRIAQFMVVPVPG